MLEAAREQVLLPALDGLIAHAARDGAARTPACRCWRARTARRRARRRVGKEIANVVGAPGARRARSIAAVALLAKMNGAVGNYNAHLAA